MKKVCFVCPWMHVAGGLQRVVTNIANKLSEDYDVSICIVSISKEQPYYKLNETIKVFNLSQAAFNNACIIKKALGKISQCTGLLNNKSIEKWIFYYKKRINALEEFIIEKDFDIVISSSGDLNLLLSMIDKNKVKAKLIGWQHNSYRDYFQRRGFYYYGRENLAKENYINLDSIVTLTNKDSKMYKKHMGIETTTIYNPLTFMETTCSSVDKHELLFVGRLDWEQKGLSHLYDVVSQIFQKEKYLNWSLIIVGDGKDKDRLEKNFKSLNLMDQVKFLGNMEDVRPFYREASILLNTSNWEGFGLVITEAFECGVPVVAFDTDGPSEIINDGVNGFIVPKYSIDKYIEKVELLMDDNKLRNLFSHNAKIRSTMFQLDTVAKKWKDLIEELL